MMGNLFFFTVDLIILLKKLDICYNKLEQKKILPNTYATSDEDTCILSFLITGQVPDSKTPVYCMQFDISDLEERDVTSFTATLQNDVSSLKPDIVYIQQTKQSVSLIEIGLRMKGLGYEGYEQKVTPELKQATYFRSNLLRGLYGSPVVTHAATTR